MRSVNAIGSAGFQPAFFRSTSTNYPVTQHSLKPPCSRDRPPDRGV
jgi:hypothetical protein